jgi:hypothetical protein
MKKLFAFLLVAGPLVCSEAATSIDPVNRYAYGANIGWMDWYADGVNGAVISDYACSGYIYAANVGWINLGSGSPTNSIRYQNLSGSDFGVNNDGLGNLRGYAWGANIGWINFESTGAPTVDLHSGIFSGYVWSANCGWISLSNAFAYVQTDHILPGTLDTNGLPIAWEMSNFGHTGVDPNADPDHDGMSNMQEYLAGTDPNNASSILQITNFTRDATGYNIMAWTSVPTRYYYIQRATVLGDPTQPFVDALIYWGLGWHSTGFYDTNDPGFYRVRAFRPLTP